MNLMTSLLGSLSHNFLTEMFGFLGFTSPLAIYYAFLCFLVIPCLWMCGSLCILYVSFTLSFTIFLLLVYPVLVCLIYLILLFLFTC